MRMVFFPGNYISSNFEEIKNWFLDDFIDETCLYNSKWRGKYQGKFMEQTLFRCTVLTDLSIPFLTKDINLTHGSSPNYPKNAWKMFKCGVFSGLYFAPVFISNTT